MVLTITNLGLLVREDIEEKLKLVILKWLVLLIQRLIVL